MSSAAPRALPDINDRLVTPETRYEMLDGELVYVSPADPLHGERHVQLAALVEAHAGPAFQVAADLLTRTSEIDDIAPDVSVYPDTPDPRTGRRQLEQLAFEIASTQSLGKAGVKAKKLATRGVRRVFAIDVAKSRVLEWSRRRGRWQELDASGYIDDPALEVPLPIAAMVHAAKTDDAVARALVAKRNPVIEAVRAEDRAEGRIEALLALFAARGIKTAAARERIVRERDLDRLDRWIVRGVTATTLAEVLDAGDEAPRPGASSDKRRARGRARVRTTAPRKRPRR